MTTVNRLATPLPDSVLDRYFAENPSETDFRKKASVEASKTDPAPEPDERDFQQIFDV